MLTHKIQLELFLKLPPPIPSQTPTFFL